MPLPTNDGQKAAILRLAAIKCIENLKELNLDPGAQLTLAEFCEVPALTLAIFYDIIDVASQHIGEG